MIIGKTMINEPLLREQFAHLVPHTGTMLLIDEVVHWDVQHIITRCYLHKQTAHPLRLAVNYPPYT